MEGLAYNGDNPGSVQYGNFINYYQFHPADERIKVLPLNIWSVCNSFVILDIGCNTGDLTLSLYKYFTKYVCKDCKIIGIDIDPVLIERANEQNKYKDVTFKCVNFMESKERDILGSYLNTLNVPRFDAIFCFSISMWIHLNHGDSGLEEFLHEICMLSNTIVIEPQPWKCYKSAVKRLKLYHKEFSCYKDLKLKDPNSDIECMILQKGFYKTNELCENTWKRKIFIFNKTIC